MRARIFINLHSYFGQHSSVAATPVAIIKKENERIFKVLGPFWAVAPEGTGGDEVL